MTILDDGTKIREYDDVPLPEFPESIDLKITNYCDAGCGFCHEKSTIHGAHALEDEIIRLIEGLPAGTELAIGGGNPASYPNWKLFGRIKELGLIANLTVHCSHLYSNRHNLTEWLQNGYIRGLGISVPNAAEYDFWQDMDVKHILQHPHVVYHIIAGIFPPQSLLSSPMMKEKLLVLGYKNYGFGEAYYSEKVERCLAAWRYFIPVIIQKAKSVSFDNLAIEQLNIQKLVSPKTWDSHYMGNDGQFTMYIDAVRREFAKSSTSPRYKLGKLSIKEAFQKIREES